MDPLRLVGRDIDGCTISRFIGAGQQGMVYLAEHRRMNTRYAVKVLDPALTAAPHALAHFFQEAQYGAQLEHPGIVRAMNVGQEHDRYFIRMELVDGETAEGLVRQRGKFDWRRASRIVTEVAEALSHVHRRGIVHRDIEPGNVMLTRGGTVKLSDFGLAQRVQRTQSTAGRVAGTLAFMSPEQADGRDTDARSDIFSLGATFYFLMTGSKGYEGRSAAETLMRLFFYTPVSPRIHAPEVPDAVCDIMRRCLRKKKNERYQTAAELLADLRALPTAS